MRVGLDWLRVCVVLAFPALSCADCIAFHQAGKHIGETQCITGKVVQVKQSYKGVTYLNFCDDYRRCPFAVVVFARDLKHVGDVRQLQGKVIEIHGPVKEYDGRAEIILRQARQLSGEAAQIPPLPKGYDVEKKGQFSAGKFGHPSSGRKPAKQKQGPPVQIEESEADGPPE
jgi:hypothetical protein